LKTNNDNILGCVGILTPNMEAKIVDEQGNGNVEEVFCGFSEKR
jgi:hypothetical protein